MRHDSRYQRTIVRVEAAQKGTIDIILPRISSSVQIVASIATLSLAVWALFFSSIPEALERQLRVEVVEAKEEAISIRQANTELERRRLAIEQSNSDLTTESDRLEDQIASLNAQSAEIALSLSRLKAERATYANEARRIITAKVSTFAAYELDMMSATASACARYSEHRRWLEAKRKLQTMDQTGYFTDDNRYAEWERLQSVHLPDFWFDFPQEPNLDPAVFKPQLLTAYDVKILDADQNFEDGHRYLINYLFDRIVESRGAKHVTVREFLSGMASYPMMDDLLEEDRNALTSELSSFSDQHTDLLDRDISIAFPAEPTSDEMISRGATVKEGIAKFRSSLFQYLAEKGWSGAAALAQN